MLCRKVIQLVVPFRGAVQHDRFFIAIFALAGTITTVYFGLNTQLQEQAAFFPNNPGCPFFENVQRIDGRLWFVLADQNFMNYGTNYGSIQTCLHLENAYCNYDNNETKCCNSIPFAVRSGEVYSPTYIIYMDKDNDKFSFTESTLVRTYSNPQPPERKPIRKCSCEKNEKGQFVCRAEATPSTGIPV